MNKNRKTNGINIIKALAFAVFFAGCREQAPAPEPKPEPELSLEPGLFVGETSKTIAEMAGDDVIVAVNGEALTRGLHDEAVAMFEAVHRFMNPSASANKAALFARDMGETLPYEFVIRRLMAQEAARRGLKATEEAVAAQEAALARAAARRKMTLEQAYASLGSGAAMLRETFADEALASLLRLDEHGRGEWVEEAEVDEELARLARLNERYAATNALIMARGEVFCQWIRAGEDFGALAERFSEVEDGPGGFWGEFYAHEIDDPAVREAVFNLPVGGVAGPFNTDEGMIIAKVLGHGQEAEEVQNPNMKSVRLARILLRLGAGGEGWELPGRAQVRRDLEKEKISKTQSALVRSLVQKARLEYPNGTNLWEKAKR